MNETIKKEYFELLKFESVGADPSKLRDCTACAQYLKAWLERIGFRVQLRMANGVFAPPVVFAEREGDEGASVVLFYGHYDVQPVDPIDEWKTPPFEPTVVGDRVYCRGSQDDKGQLFASLNGIRDFLDRQSVNPAAGGKAKPTPTFKIVLEGQEESGSSMLMGMAGAMRKELAADVLMVCDTSAAAALRPAIVAGLRGVSHFTMRLEGPNRDLHSGEYGGVAPNPAQGIAELVASLHNADGSIAVAGFLDGIEPPCEDERVAAAESTPGDEEFASDIGCAPKGGERAKPTSVRLGFDPTIEVNGIHSGYGGVGAKTVIPASAIAKISMRLVPGQSPQRAFEAVKAHLEARVPEGMKLTLEDFNPGAAGFRLPLASPLFRLASEVLSEMDTRGAVFIWEGASIPVISVLREVSGAAPLIVGWGQPEDRIHSPNESYSFTQFDKARDFARRFLAAL